MATLFLEAWRTPAGAPRSAVADAVARFWPLGLITAFALAIRSATFGDPVLQFDEQLYLLVGDRMLQGQLPYVDLWDRKPVGLFLFYAGVRLLGGDGIVQYQIVSALCVAATSGLIWAMARRSVGDATALLVALAYVPMLPLLGGAGGQSPVIYNMLVAAGAFACLRACDIDDPRRLLRLALFTMAVSGIAIQFKYTPVVEGMFFGCWFLLRFHQVGMLLPRLAAVGAAMVGVALLPTIAAIGYFWWVGELDSYVQANFVSVFQRRPFPPETRELQYRILGFGFGPLILVALYALWDRAREWVRGERGDRLFVMSWSVAAFCGFAMLGDFYDFYFITVLPPLLLLIAPLIRTPRLTLVTGFCLVFWPLLFFSRPDGTAARHRAGAEKLVATLRPLVRDRCLYVYDGPAVLYLLTNACAPTRYIYPDHLQNPTEAPALGVDAAAEITRILNSRPGAIVTADRAVIPRYNPRVQALLRAALARDYRRVARVTIDRSYDVWVPRALDADLR